MFLFTRYLLNLNTDKSQLRVLDVWAGQKIFQFLSGVKKTGGLYRSRDADVHSRAGQFPGRYPMSDSNATPFPIWGIL